MLSCACHDSYESDVYEPTQVLTAKFTNTMNPKVALFGVGVFEELKLFADELVFA